MDTIEKHSLWELEVESFDRVVLASDLIKFMSGETADSDVSQSILKSFIAKRLVEGGIYAKCSNCDCPVHFIARNATTEAYFRHIPSRAPSIEKMKLCSFYSNTESFFGKGQIYQGEGKWHFDTKHFLANHIETIGYHDVDIEKFIFSKDPETDKRRKPDIAFKDSKGNRFVIELTRWWMSPEVVYEREKFFRTEGYNLIWLFSPNCEESNPVTLNMILYGSAASRQEASVDVLSKVECNAFVLSDEALSTMKSQSNLTFEVVFPVPTYKLDLKQINVEKSSTLIQLDDLDLDARQRLPFAINTSIAFKNAITEKYHDDRKALALNIYELRRLAFIEPVFEYETDLNEAMQTVHRAMACVDSIQSPKRMLAYEAMAIVNINAARTNYLIRNARRQTAHAIRSVRSEIRKYLHNIDKLHSEEVVINRYNRIQNVGDKAKQYQSPMFASYLKRALVKADNELKEFQAKRNAIASKEQTKKQKSKENHILERERFIRDLEKGFDDIPVDLSALKMKKNRIILKAHEYGFDDRAMYLDHTFNIAVTNIINAYNQKHYPKLYQGWSPAYRYKIELDKAFELCALKCHKRDPQKRRIEVYQEATRLVLSQFQESINTHIELFYNEMRRSDQPTFSSIVIKNYQQCVG